jgi:hypothetical protein
MEAERDTRETHAPPSESQIKDGLAGLVDDEDLDKLKDMLGRFNLFEALGIVKSEAKHSAFLTWLLDPTQTHGFDDDFLSLFLRFAAKKADDSDVAFEAPSLFDVDGWSLGTADVRREWRNIDVFVHDQAAQLTCVIENKVNISEHSSQLARYKAIAERVYPDCPNRFYVLLSPDGVSPRNDADPYISIRYSEIADLIDRLVARRGHMMSDAVKTFALQYRDMLNDHMGDNSELQDLARRLYRRHRHAFDYVYEVKPDDVDQRMIELQEIVQEDTDLTLDNSTKSHIRFIPKEMDPFVPRGGREGWSSEGRLVLFEFENFSDRDVTIKLMMCSGPEQSRQSIYEMVRRKPGTFNSVRKRALRPSWFKLGRYELSKGNRHADPEERVEFLKSGLKRFKAGRMREVIDAFRELDGTGSVVEKEN